MTDMANGARKDLLKVSGRYIGLISQKHGAERQLEI
jgi:hypothetical protein